MDSLAFGLAYAIAAAGCGIGLGLVGGISAGPIMSLPAKVLAPAERAVGMGLYLTLFYVFVVAAPVIAGSLAARTGSAQAAFDLGALMLVLCFPAYAAYRFFADQISQAATVHA